MTISKRQKEARIRNWQILRLRGASALFRKLGSEIGQAAVNDELIKLGAELEPNRLVTSKCPDTESYDLMFKFED